MENPKFQITKSQKGKEMLEYNGYTYNFIRKNGDGSKYWRCQKIHVKNIHCCAAITTDADYVYFNQRGEHKCIAKHPIQVEFKVAEEKVLEKIKQTKGTIQQVKNIYENEISKATNDITKKYQDPNEEGYSNMVAFAKPVSEII